jgi:uncharacterized protein
MTYQDRESMIIAMRDVIVRTFHPFRIVLFGSFATGIPSVDSDVDLLIVDEGSFGPKRSRRKEAARIWQALMPFDVPKDILLYSRDEVAKKEFDDLHVIGQAMKTGKILYECAR